MSSFNIRPFDESVQTQYRRIATQFVGTLIGIRAQLEPSFLSSIDTENWPEIPEVGTSSIEDLIERAKSLNDALSSVILGPLGADSDNPMAQISRRVNVLAHQIISIEAEWQRDHSINWNRYFSADDISEIGNGLNQLPPPMDDSLPEDGPDESSPEDEHKCPVRLAGLVRHENCGYVYVNGERKRLTVARYDVVSALVRAYPNTLTKDQLVRESGRGGALNMFKAIKKIDSDWDAVIQPAKVTGGGYGIVAKSS